MKKITFESLKSNKLDLVILVGGKGTRIKQYLRGLPKPMVKFNNKHFLQYILNVFCKYHFRRIFLLTGYKNSIIFKKFHNRSFNFIKTICLKEKKIMGTGGALNNIKKKVNDFILINGDTIFNINLLKLVHSLKKNKFGSIALLNNSKQESFKLNNLVLKNNIVKYTTKGNLMNGGIYYFKKKIFKYIPNKNCSLENDILPELINKKKINGKIFNNFFIDIGTKDYFHKASKKLYYQFKRPAIFLDRDGVINYDYGYVHSLKKFKFKKKVIEGLKYLNEKKYYIFIITNQSGIGKKIFTEKQFINLHLFLKKYLQKKNIFVNDVKYSPYHPNARINKYKKRSYFRKPGNLMIKSILKNWDVDLKNSFMIGDKYSDLLAAKKSKLKFYYSKNNFLKQIKSITK